LFGCSRQAYYRRLKKENQMQFKSKSVVALVQEVRHILPRVGTRKLYHMLYKPLQELGVGRDALFAIMKANHLDIKPKRQYRTTTNSHHRFRKHKNLIKDLEITQPEQVWVSDITYIGCRTQPMYLSLITDAYSKKIVGYNVSESLAVDSSIRALKMAIKDRCYKHHDLIHHSDRGLQYCSSDYQFVLNKYHIRPSMTESYDPYSNAVAERINGILKDEFMIEQVNLDKSMMQLYIKDCVKRYNMVRPHYSCDLLTPDEMHMQNNIKMKTYKKSKNLQTKLQIFG
jgi:transposase InsO family protein